MRFFKKSTMTKIKTKLKVGDLLFYLEKIHGIVTEINDRGIEVYWINGGFEGKLFYSYNVYFLNNQSRLSLFESWINK